MKKKENVAAAPADDTTEEVVPEVSKGRKIANTIINVILVLAIVLAAVCTYTSYVSSSGHGVPSLFGIRVLSIQTESMYPTLKPGDLIFLEKTYNTTGASHIGIYVGNNTMLHCGDPIQYTSISSDYWQSHFLQFGRLAPT